MSPLPQRKKTAEEIQQLRDQLRVPSPPAQTKPASPAPLASPAVPQVPHPIPPAAQDIPAEIPTALPDKHFHRTFKRSEWEQPRPRRTPVSSHLDSSLPARRHSRAELEEMRRRQALANFSTEAPIGIFPQPASAFIIALGYLFATASFHWLYWQQTPLELTGGFAIIALCFAAWILVFRPVSRHHSGFIGIMVLFALSFAALHYFPQLRYAS